MTKQQVKIWFKNRRNTWKKRENGRSEQAGERVKKGDTESISDKKDGIESLITEQFNAELYSEDLKLARYKSSLSEKILQVQLPP